MPAQKNKVSNQNKVNNPSSPIAILSSEEISTISRNVAEKLSSIEGRYSYLDVEYHTFPNGEISVRIPQTIRSKEVYFFHSLYHPDPNISLIKMLLTNNAISLASVKSLVLVILYIPYLRQDRKDQPRVPISARALANIIETNKAVKRIVTMDMHVEQEEGFFNIPVDNLKGRILHADYFKNKFGKKIKDFMVVSPDFGGALRAQRFAKLLGEEIPVGILEKERKSGSAVVTHQLIGENPKGKCIILYDDMIDTGNTIIASVRALYARGARQVYVCATHGIFSPTSESSAEEKFRKEKIQVVITSSIPRSLKYRKENKSWLTVLPVEELLTKVLYQSDLHGGSVSSLFSK